MKLIIFNIIYFYHQEYIKTQKYKNNHQGSFKELNWKSHLNIE